MKAVTQVVSMLSRVPGVVAAMVVETAAELGVAALLVLSTATVVGAMVAGARVVDAN